MLVVHSETTRAVIDKKQTINDDQGTSENDVLMCEKRGGFDDDDE